MISTKTTAPKRSKNSGSTRSQIRLRNEDRTEGKEILPSVKSCPIATALAALNNNSTKVVSETKLGTSTKVVFNTEVLATLRGLFPSNKTYRFQIHAYGTITSSAGGVIGTAVSSSPLVITYSEWAALSALFDECKLLTTKLGITSSALPANKAVPLWIAYDHVTSSGVAPGFGNVQRLAESKAINSLFMDGGSGRHMQSAHIAPSRLYAGTSAPIVSAGFDCGMNGQWDIVGQDTTGNSLPVGYYDIEHVVSFRNRA
jgi:hypothetical protein